MENPFQPGSYADIKDADLVQASLGGSKAALEALIKRHQDYIYNVALRMVMNTHDAEDLTQEVLIKVITKLSQFGGRSSFRTWLYRIVFNHFLNMKRSKMETVIQGFDHYGENLDLVPDHDMSETEKFEQREVIEEAKIGCMSGMLMCLNREQRLVLILGDIFSVDHGVASDMLDISRENFRKRLQRARADLYQFMNRKCGLINKNNPCRCHKKTKGFIKNGWVNPQSLEFNSDFKRKIRQASPLKTEELQETIETEYADLFRDHPFQEKEVVQKLSRDLIQDDRIKTIFNLN